MASKALIQTTKQTNQTTTTGKPVSILKLVKEEKSDGADGVKDTILKLQEEVKVLQSELIRTQRELAQRQVLLSNSLTREIELRVDFGAR